MQWDSKYHAILLKYLLELTVYMKQIKLLPPPPKKKENRKERVFTLFFLMYEKKPTENKK